MITLNQCGPNHETDMDPTFRDVTEYSASTLDLDAGDSIWRLPSLFPSPALWMMSVRFGTAKGTEGRSHPPGRSRNLHAFFSFVSPLPRVVTNTAEVAALLFSSSDSRSACLGLEDKRTKCVNPMGGRVRGDTIFSLEYIIDVRWSRYTTPPPPSHSPFVPPTAPLFCIMISPFRCRPI